MGVFIHEKKDTKTSFLHILKKIFDTEEKAEDFHLNCNQSFVNFVNMSADDAYQLAKDIGVRRYLTRKKLMGFYYHCHVNSLRPEHVDKYEYPREGIDYDRMKRLFYENLESHETNQTSSTPDMTKKVNTTIEKIEIRLEKVVKNTTCTTKD